MFPSQIWANAPKAVKSSNKPLIQVNEPETKKTPEVKTYPAIIPAGQKCKHGKWQPEAVETTTAKAWSCYECAFVCTVCGQNRIGLCDSYSCI